MAGNTASNSSRRKWISGDSNCEAFAVRKTRSDSRSAAYWRTPRFDAAAYRRRTAPRAARAAANASRGPHRQQPQGHRGIHSHGERHGWDDHSQRGHSARHQVHFGKSPNAAEGRSERGSSTANEPGRITRSCRVSISRAAVLEYRLSSEPELTPPPPCFW